MTATENWDDDFEFNPNSPPRKKKNSTGNSRNSDHAGQTRMSTTSSRFTIDWDADAGGSPIDTSPSRRAKVFTAPRLLDSADIGPSTPARHLTITENWDDDFEDKSDTPVRRTRGDQSSPTKEITRNHRSMQPLSNNENVDHKSLALGRNRASSSASTQYNRSKNTFSGDFSHHTTLASDVDEEDDEFGFADKDEDRTVTGRLRRPGPARLNSMTNHPLENSPPPPVPSLPSHLSSSPKPFPRSPSSSVFSLPTTIAGESLYYGSTAHLHPASRTSSSLVGLAHRPTTPPVQKERERRRLRKKNRPQPQGVFELIPVESSFSSGLAALHEVDRPQTPTRDSIHSGSHSRPRTPQTPISSAPSSAAPSPIPGVNTTPSSNRHGSPNRPPSTPSGAKNALLSRIGSVKKWGARKKRLSTTQQEGTTGTPEDPSRPASSLSSLPPSSTSSHHAPPSRPVSPRSPNQNGGWFFRSSSAFSPSAASGSASLESPPAHMASSRNSTADLSLRGRSHDGGPRPSVEMSKSRDSGPSSSRNESGNRNRTPSRRRERLVAEDVNVGGPPDTPSKLSKRKSLGFAQLRRTLSGVGNGDVPVGSDGFRVEGSPGQPRHASYGAASYKSGDFKTDVFRDRENLNMPGNLPNDVRGRKKSLSIIKAKARQDAPDVEKPQAQDVGKAFTRSIKRISIIGRHTRQKSGPGGTGVPLAAGRTSLGSRPEPIPFSMQEVAKDVLGPQNLLPPIEILGPLNLLPPVEIQTQPLPTETEIFKSRPEDVNSDVKPLLPQSPRRTDDPRTPPTSPKRTLPKSPKSPERGTTSPQSVSLGRSAYSPTRKSESPDEKVTPRRNSLGDLKIPARISQAQVGIRRDLGMVREFAQNVEQLKGLQATYHGMVVEIQALLDNHAHIHSQQQATRSVSPVFFSRPVGRKRSNTNPGPTPQHIAYKQLASEFYTINSKYRITWECAELLIELGGGSSTGASYGPKTSVSAPVVQGSNDGGSSLTRRMGRERAITLAGDESKPPSPLPGMKSLSESPSIASSSSAAWRASAGRQELTQRQMVLLKELLNNADPFLIGGDTKPALAIPEEPSTSTSVNRDWKWGDPGNSTVTLPPSEGSGPISRPPSSATANKERRASRIGMAGLRDLLKMLKRHHTAHPAHPMPSLGSTASLTSATNSSSEMYSGCPSSSDINHVEGERQPVYGRRRAKTSIGPESLSSSRGDLPSLPMSSTLFDSTPLPTRQSRGRPSLAAIFRLPNSFKSSKASGPHSVQSDYVGDKKGKNVADGDRSPAEEDWDRIEPLADSHGAGTALVDGTATVRGKGRSPYLYQLPPSSFSGSRTSSRPKVPASGSRTSLYEDSPSSSSHNLRSTRLSNVDEGGHGGDESPATRPPSRPPPSSSSNSHVMPLSPPPRMSSRYFNGNKTSYKNGSVRSMPPQPPPELKLAMAPENIKPLVENAKEVHARLVECIAEIRTLLENHSSLPVGLEPA